MSMTVFQELKEHAESIKNDEHQVVGPMAVGDTYWQGDLGVVYYGEALPKDAEPIEASAQLVPGQTEGARHVLESVEGIGFYRRKNATVCDGPFLVAPAGFRVNHPRHGDLTFGSGIYAIIYQRQYAEELRRAMD